MSEPQEIESLAEKQEVIDKAWWESLRRARATRSDTWKSAGFGVLLTMEGGSKVFLATHPGGTPYCWPDAEAASFGLKLAFDGYGQRSWGEFERVEIVRLRRGQRMMTRAELRELGFKKRAYKQSVALGLAKSALEDLTVDGCEYGDDCPAFSGSRHGVCRACRAKRVLDRIKVVEAT